MKILVLALISSALLAIGCDPAAITGSGNVTNKDHAVTTFDKMTVKGSIDVDVTYGTTPSVRIETDENLHGRVTVTVVNDMLDISVDGNNVDFTKLKAHVVMPSITALTLRSEAPRSKPTRQPSRLRPSSFPVSRAAGTSSAVHETTENSLSYTVRIN